MRTLTNLLNWMYSHWMAKKGVKPLFSGFHGGLRRNYKKWGRQIAE